MILRGAARLARAPSLARAARRAQTCARAPPPLPPPPARRPAAAAFHDRARACRVYASQPARFSASWAVFRVAGDGACLFRSLAQGAHLAAAAPGAPARPLSAPEEDAAAAALRSAVCDELERRRDELAPFIDGDFAAYVAQIRQPRAWGGEPELAAAPHVLRRPVSVFSPPRGRGGALELVSRYGGDEYGAAPDAAVLFHGGGHYDALARQGE
jgi:OTU domain-containing protein 6